MPDILPNRNNNKKKPQVRPSFYWLYAVIMVVLFAAFYFDDQSASKEVNYTEFENIITDSINVRAHGITKITVEKKKGVAEAELSDSLTRMLLTHGSHLPST